MAVFSGPRLSRRPGRRPLRHAAGGGANRSSALVAGDRGGGANRSSAWA